ncbi:hypothetical protein G9P44_002947 [Scheffersomyces stipitis]|nr:hypothetical protein G9P44_002947 [Scheffersomyces stipitis]
MMTQNGPDSEEESSDSDSESESSSSDSDDDEITDASPAKAGVIERISLKNFMCHDSFELELGPQINFIIGRNGSGKSAILTGISVGLGAKASDTNRGTSIKSFIKDGKSTARVTIVFLNEGPEAYRPEEFGKRIIIERKLQRIGGNTYAIRSHSGRTISTKKATLDEILYKFSITIDNPLAFLSQDKAREFLMNTSDEQKYSLFMSGAFITNIIDNFGRTSKNIAEINSKIVQAQHYRKACKDSYNEIASIYNRHKKSDYLRNKLQMLYGKILWYNVTTIEKKVNSYEEQAISLKEEIKSADDKIVECNEFIENAPEEIAVLEKDLTDKELSLDDLSEKHSKTNDTRQDAKNTSSQLLEECKENAKVIQSLQEKIETRTKDIEKEQRKIDEINGGSREKLRLEYDELSAEIQNIEEQLTGIKRTIEITKSSANPNMDSHKSTLKDRMSQLESLQKRRQDSQRAQKDRYFAWGREMSNVIQRIRSTNTWHKLPIGPLGADVEVKSEYSKWSALINTVLNRMLDSFIVCDEHDRRLLESILAHYSMKKTIIVRKFESFDFSNGKVSGHPTFVDMITCKNEEVLRALVDSMNIEKLVISDKNESPSSILNERNVMSVFTLSTVNSGTRYGKAGDTIRMDPVYYSKDIVKLAVTGADELHDVVSLISEEKLQIDILQKRLREMQSHHQNEIVNLEKKKNEFNEVIRRKKRKLDEIESKINEEGDLSNIEKYKSEIEAHKDQIKTREGVIEALTEDLESRNEILKKLKESVKELKVQLTEATAARDRAKKNLHDYEVELSTNKDNRVSYLSEKKKIETQLEKTNAKIEEGNNKLQQLIDEAEKKCRREEVTITSNDTQDSIRDEYALVQTQVKEAEKQIGKPFEEIQNDLIEAKERQRLAEESLKNLSRTYKSLDSDLKIRFNFVHTTILSSVEQASRTFENCMALRGFKGSLSFDHGERKLTLLAQTKSDDKQREVTSLSGGEKSFAQISLLLSIWKVMDSKIRGLDEFDVFMDSVNRSISIKLLLNELRQYPKSQNIFITPQDIAVVGDLNSSDVKIHKMSDPRKDT